MADKDVAHRVPGRPARKITLSAEELSASLDSFLVGAPEILARGPVVAREDTFDIDCTDGATCNFKCGPTAYWECGPSSFEATCDSLADTCYSCGYNCPSYPPACP